MKYRHWIAICVISLILFATMEVLAQRGGGRGGGGRGGGGGGMRGGGGGGMRAGGGARPSMGGGGMNRTPSFSSPRGGAGVAQMPANRPGAGAGGGIRPGGGRPNVGGGLVDRPNIGGGVGARPGGNRPNIGGGSGLSQRPSVGNRPGGRPGISTLPSTRPDFGGRRNVGAGIAAGAIGAGVANRASLPGLGDRRAAANRPLQDRRQELSNRLTGEGRPGQLPARDWSQVRQDWQDNRDQVRQDWQDHRDQAREDWQNWFDDHYPGYGGWYWGHAPGYWNRWDNLWDNYPVAAAVGLTSWGANTLASSFGCGDYYNPYYEEGQAVSYAEPVVSVAVEEEATASEQPQPPGVSREALDKFDQARLAFQQKDYEKSLQLINETVRLLPHDAVVHEFRALVLFALKRYTESAAALHAVLAVGPGWDAKTLTSLYPDMETYTAQFRALESARDQDPKKADVRFLLGYHYLTCGYPNEAAAEFRQAAELQPKNAVAASLAATLAPRDSNFSAAAIEKDAAKPVPVNEIAGAWAAAGKGEAKYSMNLQKDGGFTWSFARGPKKEGVKGVYTIEGNVLAMEPDTGGTLLAELTFNSPDGLHFKMIGGAADDPGLDFLREK